MTSLSASIRDLTNKLDGIFTESEFDNEIAALVESLINEDSTLLSLVGKDPQGRNLARYLHRFHKFGNTAKLEPIPVSDKPEWMDFKEYADNVLFMQGQNGWAFFKPVHGYQRKGVSGVEKGWKGDNAQPYEFYVSLQNNQILTDKELEDEISNIEKDRDPRGRLVTDKEIMTPHFMRKGTTRAGMPHRRDVRNPNNMFDMVKEKIGKITAAWMATEREDLSGSKDQEDKIRQSIIAKLGLPSDPSFWQHGDRQKFEKERERYGTLAGGKAGKKLFDKPGASRETNKMSLRRPDRPTSNAREDVAERLYKIAPAIYKQILIRLKRKGASDDTLDSLRKRINLGSVSDDTFWTRSVRAAINDLAAAKGVDSEELATQAKTDNTLLQDILKGTRDTLTNYF